MKEQDQICENFINIIHNEDIRKYAGDAFWDFIQALFTKDVFSGISSLKNIKDMIFHIPTVFFWSKMQRFLLGTYHDFEEQIKMANRFGQDNDKYKEFVCQLMETIDKLDTEMKVDYFSNLTRSFLLEQIDDNLFYKLRQVLMNCTLFELEFIKKHGINDHLNYDMTIFSLINQGIVNQAYNTSYYSFTDLAKCLKEHSLNEEEPKHKIEYSKLTPPDVHTIATDDEVKEVLGIFSKND